MSGLQSLKVFVQQRLAAAVEEIFGHFERTITEYEEELGRRHRNLLDVGLKRPERKLRRAGCPGDLQEEVPPEQQEWSPSLDQEDPPERPFIKEEEEELWSSQEGEQLPGLEEDDITKFPFTPAPVKSEDDEEKPQSSQLHQSQTEQMEAGGEDCGGPEPARDSDPDRLLQFSSSDKATQSYKPEYKTEDSSETEDSDDWEETREPHSGLNSLSNEEASVSRRTHVTDDKQFSCSECGKRFGNKPNLRIHMKIHTGENSFSCLVCGIIFSEGGDLRRHMVVHTGKERFSCSICGKGFTLLKKRKKHKCVGRRSLRLHQSQTEQMVADGEDCVGPDRARDSDADRV
ncbi:zinc finger and BTB domain-containing protein 49-like [Micropterus salmoides]|uniref:zinc finger and BTB domain-containing protein 49-like n=1 Tax=Micropterus salmoides TaxID=27706 RepID=UPI0018EBD039|nr:zinc finger and BTB domain-containing protein 49-like [Micropterus salmoides]